MVMLKMEMVTWQVMETKEDKANIMDKMIQS